jgi:hypothetical protein
MTGTWLADFFGELREQGIHQTTLETAMVLSEGLLKDRMLQTMIRDMRLDPRVVLAAYRWAEARSA